MKTNENIDVNGFYRVRLIDKHGDVLKESSHNFVVDKFKKALMADSISTLFKLGLGNPYGYVLCNDNTSYSKTTAASAFLSFNDYNKLPAVVALNLDDSVIMDSDTNFLNIIASDGSGVDESKVTAYSTGRNSSTIEKEGILQDITSADMMSPLGQIVNTFVWDLDKGNGSFNWLAVMPSFEISPYRSLGTFKCISSYRSWLDGNSFVNGFVLPGVQDTQGNVLTGPNEILTFENNGASSRWFYNIITGEKRAVQPNELAYNWNSNIVTGNSAANTIGQQLVIGDFLYVINSSSLYKININTGETVGSVVVASTASTVDNSILMYYNGANIIVSCNTSSTSEANAYVSTVNISNMTKTKVNNNVYTGWGGLPTTYLPRNIAFTKIQNYYIVELLNDKVCLVCTDIMNVCGSLVGIMPSTMARVFEVAGSIYSINQFVTNPAVNVYNQSNQSLQFDYDGVYISDFTFTNFFSATKLDQTYTKTNEMKLIIDYGYTFGPINQTSVNIS